MQRYIFLHHLFLSNAIFLLFFFSIFRALKCFNASRATLQGSERWSDYVMSYFVLGQSEKQSTRVPGANAGWEWTMLNKSTSSQKRTLWSSILQTFLFYWSRFLKHHIAPVVYKACRRTIAASAYRTDARNRITLVGKGVCTGLISTARI